MEVGGRISFDNSTSSPSANIRHIQSSTAAFETDPTSSPPVNAIDVLDDANRLNLTDVQDKQSYDGNMINIAWNIRPRGSLHSAKLGAPAEASALG